MAAKKKIRKWQNGERKNCGGKILDSFLKQSQKFFFFKFFKQFVPREATCVYTLLNKDSDENSIVNVNPLEIFYYKKGRIPVFSLIKLFFPMTEK